MFSLTYSAAYDPYHTVFRMLTLFSVVDSSEPLDFETLRIVDFYHTFPWLLKGFSAYSKIEGFQKHKNGIVRNYPQSRFDILPDKHFVFQRMLPPQLSARHALTGCLMAEFKDEKLYVLQSEPKSAKLRELVQAYRDQNGELLAFLMTKLAKIPLFGPGGLKDRSGLGEFRYDVV